MDIVLISIVHLMPSLNIYHSISSLNAVVQVTMGTCDGKKVLMWPGLYDGKGGSFTPAGGDVPASACDNFWEYV